MDKNFVNIDDLVRQRLGGGEEQERSGAWLRMSELLGKEMPKVRPAGFMWRRMFSAVAVCILIASISVGGYELSAFKNTNSANTDAVIAAAFKTHTTNSTVNNNEINNKQSSATPASENNSGNDERNAKTPIAANDSKVNKDAKDHKTTGHQLQVADNVPVNMNVPGNTAKANTTKVNDAPNESAFADNTTNNNKQTNKPVKTNNAKANTHQLPIAAKFPANVSKHDGKIAENKEVAKNVPPADHKAQNVKTPGNTAVAAKNTKVAKHTPVIKEAKTGNKEVAVVNKPAKTAGNNPNTNNKQAGHAVAVNTPVAKKDNNKTLVAKHSVAKNVNVNKLPLGAGVNTTKGTAGINDHKDGAKNTNSVNKNVANKNTVTGKDASVATGVAVNKPGNKVPGNNTSRSVTAKTGSETVADNIAMKEKMAKTARKGKRVIEKMVLNERLIKTTPHAITHLDTISIESVTEEYDLAANETNPDDPKSPLKTRNTNTTTTNSGTDENAPIPPGAAAPTTEKPAVANKENAAKKSFGAKTMESLSQAFNDIKYRAGNVQFAPGLIGGVNGTFFGPNSFKGFQFGLTGNFVFSDALSLMTELKYFHRINNDYSLFDNYYDYTPNPNGGYDKQQHLNWYSFSTLHSFEMPITVKFSNGDFSFYAGVNLVYTFSVNTGAADQKPTTATPVVNVSSIGNDNAPKLNDQDFNARFGLGYVFGISYMISPKVNLDLRETQTFWDNSKVPGSQIVSGQLYKSPSFQLSLGYRLGSSKGKSKE